MTTTARTLPRDIGVAERSLRRLLELRIDTVGLTFAQWVALAFISETPLPPRTLVDRLVRGMVCSAGDADALVAGLRSRGLVDAGPDLLSATSSATALTAPVREDIDMLVERLYDDLPAADLQATRCTLATISGRAAQLLDAQPSTTA